MATIRPAHPDQMFSRGRGDLEEVVARLGELLGEGLQSLHAGPRPHETPRREAGGGRKRRFSGDTGGLLAPRPVPRATRLERPVGAPGGGFPAPGPRSVCSDPLPSGGAPRE